MKAYQTIEKQFSRISSLDHANAILSWDEAAMMPAGAGDARAIALAELKVLKHEILVSAQLFENLQMAEQEASSLSGWQRSNLREIKQMILNARAVSRDLVEAASLANSRCEQAWRGLRADNNWKDFLPLFEKVVSLSREEASQRSASTGLAPYDSLLDQFNPGLTSLEVTQLFDQVKSFLPDLIQRVVEKQKSLQIIEPAISIPIEQQKKLGLDVMKTLGFDFNHGRLDVSHHPFCGGVPQDVRITTRYNTSNFIESLMGVIHETGHACYEQGLPKEWGQQPVGMARGMHIHESQSLLYEIFVGRSKSFLEFLHPLICKYLGMIEDSTWSKENLYNLFNRVKPDFIRVNADEVTYPAHVVLRYEIERDLISRNIEPSDIPELWNEKMSAYLGLDTRGNYKNGCMQDMHWPAGAFGYFPSYSLGAMTAAQLFASIEKVIPNIHSLISQGDLAPLQQWLKGHIWSQGCFSSTNELLVHATGEQLKPSFFKEHIERKYLA
ncbi:MAG: hypothetical protein RJB66_2115 [Pseudomonadota bacterium]|jgi:carboxypeptidase Taq